MCDGVCDSFGKTSSVGRGCGVGFVVAPVRVQPNTIGLANDNESHGGGRRELLILIHPPRWGCQDEVATVDARGSILLLDT
jgi:hypothetical protein